MWIEILLFLDVRDFFERLLPLGSLGLFSVAADWMLAFFIALELRRALNQVLTRFARFQRLVHDALLQMRGATMLVDDLLCQRLRAAASERRVALFLRNATTLVAFHVLDHRGAALPVLHQRRDLLKGRRRIDNTAGHG